MSPLLPACHYRIPAVKAWSLANYFSKRVLAGSGSGFESRSQSEYKSKLCFVRDNAEYRCREERRWRSRVSSRRLRLSETRAILLYSCLHQFVANLATNVVRCTSSKFALPNLSPLPSSSSRTSSFTVSSSLRPRVGRIASDSPRIQIYYVTTINKRPNQRWVADTSIAATEATITRRGRWRGRGTTITTLKPQQSPVPHILAQIKASFCCFCLQVSWSQITTS